MPSKQRRGEASAHLPSEQEDAHMVEGESQSPHVPIPFDICVGVTVFPGRAFAVVVASGDECSDVQ